MDVVANLFEGTRARGAFALRTILRSPSALRILARSPLTLIAAVAGDTWVVPDEGEPLRLSPGDIAITRAPDLYNVATGPAVEPDIFIHPNQECRDAAGRSLHDELMFGVRAWGNDPDGDTVFLVGAYEQLSDISDRLVRTLPPVLRVAREDFDSPLIRLLEDEVAKDEPGQAAVLDRLFDLLLTSVLKTWFRQESADQPAIRKSMGDPLVEKALRLIYADPSRSWTVDQLALETNASRASLARRFHDVIGEPPMTFMKNWRMALAADMLTRRGETIASVAAKVGYQSPFAFSAAFKKTRGLSPQDHRAASHAA